MTLNKFQFQKFRHILQTICLQLSSKLDVQHVAMILEGFVVGEVHI